MILLTPGSFRNIGPIRVLIIEYPEKGQIRGQIPNDRDATTKKRWNKHKTVWKIENGEQNFAAVSRCFGVADSPETA